MNQNPDSSISQALREIDYRQRRIEGLERALEAKQRRIEALEKQLARHRREPVGLAPMLGAGVVISGGLYLIGGTIPAVIAAVLTVLALIPTGKPKMR